MLRTGIGPVLETTLEANPSDDESRGEVGGEDRVDGPYRRPGSKEVAQFGPGRNRPFSGFEAGRVAAFFIYSTNHVTV